MGDGPRNCPQQKRKSKHSLCKQTMSSQKPLPVFPKNTFRCWRWKEAPYSFISLTNSVSSLCHLASKLVPILQSWNDTRAPEGNWRPGFPSLLLFTWIYLKSPFSRIRENEPFNSPINSVPQCESLFAFFTLARKGLLVLITNAAEFNKKPLI